MAQLTEIKLPDIGDFKDVPVIEVLVKPGDTVEKETSLITLETDKATTEIPSPQAGVVKEINVKIGDKVSEGSLILTLEAEAPSVETGTETAEPAKSAKSAEAAKPAESAEPTEPIKKSTPAAPEKGPVQEPAAAVTPESAPPQATPSVPSGDIHADVAVLGAGPGGYTAAFRAA